jgi:hypothetical protein
VAPVIDWLLATWHALTGITAPRTAAFLLCDMPAEGWPNCGQDTWLLQQWTRLRVAALGAIWWARCKAVVGRPGHGSLARQAARRAASLLVAAIERDWARAQGGTDLTHDVTAAQWWQGAGIGTSIEHFKRTWARGIAPAFCVLVDDSLVLRLGLDSPVPLPP